MTDCEFVELEHRVDRLEQELEGTDALVIFLYGLLLGASTIATVLFWAMIAYGVIF